MSAVEMRPTLSTVHRLGIEPRLRHGQPQQLKGRIGIFGQRLQAGAEIVLARTEAKADHQILQFAPEGIAVIGPGAFIQQAGGQNGKAFLALRIGRCTA